MRVTVWSDYCCPWCYLALDRLDLLDELGVAVDLRPFELHPEIPPHGRRHRPGGRTAAAFGRVAAEHPTPRPLDCRLDSSRAQALLRTRLRGVREVLCA